VSAAPIAALSALGSDWSVGQLGGLGASPLPVDGGGAGAGSGSGGGFAGALTDAIQTLQSTQTTANTAAQQLATGQLSDPTTAIVAVENAQLAMEFASQIANKAVGAVQTVFQTQI
jgi:flagellar hook-basal body complex protein FliE